MSSLASDISRILPGPNGPPGKVNGARAKAIGDEMPGPGFWGEDEEPSDRGAPKSEAGPTEKPTRENPLGGLVALQKVALMGADNIRALAAKPIVYIWQDIAIVGIVVLIAGGPGEGKTTLLFLLLVARLNLGAPVSLLDREVTPAPEGKFIVLIEGEHSEGSTARKLVRSCELLGVDAGCLDRIIIVARKAVRLGSPEWLDVVKLIAAGLVSDIAVDTVARVAPANADNEAEQVAIFDAIAQAIEAAPEGEDKPVAWVLGHTKKGRVGDLTDVSGSTQRTGQTDTVLLLEANRDGGRVASTKVVFAKLREDPEDQYPPPITFSIADDGHGKKCVKTSDAREDKPKDDRPLETRIIELLHLGPQTKNAISTALGRNDADTEEAISNLFSTRAITTTKVTKRGREFKAFCLRTTNRNDS